MNKDLRGSIAEVIKNYPTEQVFDGMVMLFAIEEDEEDPFEHLADKIERLINSWEFPFVTYLHDEECYINEATKQVFGDSWSATQDWMKNHMDVEYLRKTFRVGIFWERPENVPEVIYKVEFHL